MDFPKTLAMLYFRSNLQKSAAYTLKIKIQMKARLILWSLIAICLRWSSPAEPAGQMAIPPQYPQFAFRWTRDPRIVVLERTGAGTQRPAETTVYELVEKGNRLRKVSAFILKNPYVPLTQYVMGGGRFLVTMDQWGGSGTSENCVVMYDAVFGNAKALKLDSFLPDKDRASLSSHPYMKGYTWRGIKPIVDYENFIYYPTSPAECREKNLPFIAIDLRSQTVETSPVPESLPKSTADETHRGLVWNWSSGTGAGPDWNLKFEYPPFIRATVESAKVPEQFMAWINFRESACYQISAVSGDYVRCQDDRWTDKKCEQNRPSQTDSK